MKEYLVAILVLVLAKGCCVEVKAQCTENCKGCKKKNIMQNMNQKAGKKHLSCKLTSSELRKRKEEVIAELKSFVIEKQELSNGYSYKFDGTDKMLDMLTDFIKYERQCCDFFSFKLSVSDSFIWLEISGEDGVKEFIKTELEI